MTAALITKQLGDRADRSYCFKPNCQHPENSGDAVKCQSCGALLLLKNRYRGIKIIARSDKQKTLLARDDLSSSPSYYIIQQFLEPVNKAERIGKSFAIEAAILQNKLQKLSKHQQVPQLLKYLLEDGYRYLISEYIESHSLAGQLAAYGVFKEKEIRELLLDILPILKVIHREGIVHQNLKPEHIVRRKSDRKIMLTNFGLDSIDNYSSYSAPEQVKGTAIYASDIYSLGIVCIRLLTHADPEKVLSERENVLNWRNYLDNKDKIDESLAKTIDRMIETSPELRYESVEEVLKDLIKTRNLFRLIPHKSSVRAAIMVTIALLTTRYLFIPETKNINRPDLISYTNYNNSIGQRKSAQVPMESGRLITIIAGKKQNLSVENTKIKARISGNIAITEIKQTFSNPYHLPIDAVYEFVAREKVKIDGMEITIRGQSYQSKIKKKSEAIATLARSKNKTKTIALLQQDKNHLVTNSISNILPGETVEITLRYTNKIEFKNGAYQYSFPMAILPQQKQKPGDRNIATVVEIDGGMSIYDVKSSSHKILLFHTISGVKVELLPEENFTERDFLLNYKLSSSQSSKKILTKTHFIGPYFDLHFTPAKQYDNKQIISKDIVFLIDTSRSQSGDTLELSQRLMRNFIARLNPEDTFTIIDFANPKDSLNDRPLKNTPENRKNALNYIDNLYPRSQLELSQGIERLINLPSPSDSYLRYVIFVAGESSSNSKKIIDRVQKNIKPEHRFYTFRVNYSRDRFLIDNLAEEEAVSSATKISQTVEKFIAEINEPVLTQIQVSWIGAGEKPEIYPLKIPDLLTDRPLLLYAYKSDRLSGKLKITGILPEGEKYEETIDINFLENQNDLVNVSDPFVKKIPQYWGFAKLEDLSNSTGFKNKAQTITDTAIKYQILSENTAFIAVSENLK